MAKPSKLSVRREAHKLKLAQEATNDALKAAKVEKEIKAAVDKLEKAGVAVADPAQAKAILRKLRSESKASSRSMTEEPDAKICRVRKIVTKQREKRERTRDKRMSKVSSQISSAIMGA